MERQVTEDDFDHGFKAIYDEEIPWEDGLSETFTINVVNYEPPNQPPIASNVDWSDQFLFGNSRRNRWVQKMIANLRWIVWLIIKIIKNKTISLSKGDGLSGTHETNANA